MEIKLEHRAFGRFAADSGYNGQKSWNKDNHREDSWMWWRRTCRGLACQRRIWGIEWNGGWRFTVMSPQVSRRRGSACIFWSFPLWNTKLFVLLSEVNMKEKYWRHPMLRLSSPHKIFKKTDLWPWPWGWSHWELSEICSRSTCGINLKLLRNHLLELLHQQTWVSPWKSLKLL